MNLTDNNKAFALIAGTGHLPDDWGFPPCGYHSGQSALRATLMFLRDQDGYAQLCRWYYGILRALPVAWREISGGEGYRPSFIHKAAVWSPTQSFSRDPNTGRLFLGWKPGPETNSLTGVLRLGETSELELGGNTYVLTTALHADSQIFSVSWPEFLQCEAGLAAVAGDHSISFRPHSFDMAALISKLENQDRELHSVGLLDSFLAFHRPEQKIAVAWLAAHRIESGN